MQSLRPQGRKSISYAKYGYFFILPFFIVYAFFMLYPLINTFILSFKGNAGNADASVGFQNYQYLLVGGSRPAQAIHEEFVRSFKNTIILWFGNFVPQLILSLLIAVWFTDTKVKIKGTGFFKVVMYMPNIITATSVCALFFILFANNKYGAVNAMLLDMGSITEPIRFVNNVTSSRVLVMFIQTWMWFGNTMILLMSGIMGIDLSLFEAASIDGVSNLFHESTTVQNHLETAAVFVYKHFHLQNPNYGYSASASVVLFLITGVLGIIIYRFNTTGEDRAAAKRDRKKSKNSKLLGGL